MGEPRGILSEDSRMNRTAQERAVDHSISKRVSLEQSRISSTLDQNGSPFLLTSKGSIDFGALKKEDGVKAGPMRLSIGDAENGYTHIESRHGAQIRKAGHRSILDFIEYVGGHYTRVVPGKEYENESGGKNKTYYVQLVDDHNNTLYVQLSRDGSYWNINSAGIFRKNYPKRV